MKTWPFDQPPDCAVITLRQIVEGSASILRVTHDSDDHGWQFLTLEDARVEDASVVSFREIVELDPSLLTLADLAPGWHAWRNTAGDPWRTAQNPNEDDVSSLTD